MVQAVGGTLGLAESARSRLGSYPPRDAESAPVAGRAQDGLDGVDGPAELGEAIGFAWRHNARTSLPLADDAPTASTVA